ncbi:protein MAINTENANCE OF MERISTEMS [Senna tora]|uniref:Protein MAINTENANCE OF MERISTEMS n=1 Tax=Senna tora TaxID=362788 RepID=A0A834SCA8_9FABA|nr:protein MAINTENANCE OF MERISTEMS [Senna tora]
MPLEGIILGWKTNLESWKSWVDLMITLHKPTWEKAGILEVILGSTYRIIRDKRNYLLHEIAEKWCLRPRVSSFLGLMKMLSILQLNLLEGLELLWHQQFLLIWVWERFPGLRPQPNELKNESQDWLDGATWSLEDDRQCEIGFGFFCRGRFSEIAGNHYDENISNFELYIPPRRFEAEVSERYLKWWKQFVLGQKEEPRKLTRPQKRSLESSDRLKNDSEGKGKKKHENSILKEGSSLKRKREGEDKKSQVKPNGRDFTKEAELHCTNSGFCYQK